MSMHLPDGDEPAQPGFLAVIRLASGASDTRNPRPTRARKCANTNVHCWKPRSVAGGHSVYGWPTWVMRRNWRVFRILASTVRVHLSSAEGSA